MRRFLCFLLSLALVLLSISVAAFATETTEDFKKLTNKEKQEIVEAQLFDSVLFDSNGDIIINNDELLFEGSFTDTVEYMNYKKTGGVIVVIDDVKLEKSMTLQPVNGNVSFIVVNGRNIEFDLNGYTLSQQAGVNESLHPVIVIPSKMSLEIKDSSVEMKGYVNGVRGAISVQGGSFRFSGGNLMAQAQASYYPDDGELVVEVIQNGEFSMTGGVILFDGQLIDGRTYYAKSGPVYIDKESTGKISGGLVFGKLETDDKENLCVDGGFYDYDITEYMADGSRMEYRGYLYHVVNDADTVNVRAVVDGSSVPMTVRDETNEDGLPFITLFLQDVEHDNGSFEKISFELTELFEKIESLETENCPSIIISFFDWQIGVDSESVERIMKKAGDNSVFLEGVLLDADTMEFDVEISDVKKILAFSFVDENGEKYKTDSVIGISLPYFVENSMVYSVFDGANDYAEKEHKNFGDLIVISAMDGEIIAIAEKKSDEELVKDEENVADKGEVEEHEEDIVEDPYVAITGNTLDIQNDISMIFYADVQGVKPDKVRMLFWSSPQSEYTEATAEKCVQYVTKDEKGFRFVYSGIASNEMNKKIYARIVTEDAFGNIIYGDEPIEGISVVDLTQNLMDDEDAKPLLIKMLNYGTAAQEYFGNTDAPANVILEERDRVIDYTPVYKSENETIPEETKNGKCEAKIAGKTLSLEGTVSINYYVSSQETVDEIGMIFWTESAFDSVEKHIVGTQSKRLSTYSENGNFLVFSFDGISSENMYDSVYARVYTKKDGIYRYGDIEKYGIKDYVANQIDKNENPKLIKLLRAMMLYGKEAEKYFDNKNRLYSDESSDIFVWAY